MTTLKSNMLKKGKKGFTLTELAIVIAVIAILIAVLVPTFTSVITNARKTAAAEDATNAITAYTLENTENVPDGSILVVKGSSDYYFIVEGSSAIYSEDADETEYVTELNTIANTKNSSTTPTGYTEFNWTTVKGETKNSEYYDNYHDYIIIYLYNDIKTATSADAATAAAIYAEYKSLFTNSGYIAITIDDTTTYFAVTVTNTSTSVDTTASTTSVSDITNTSSYKAIDVDGYSNVTIYVAVQS